MPVVRISDKTKKKILKIQGLYQAQTGERISEGRVIDYAFQTIQDDIKLVMDLDRAGKLK